MHHDRVCLSFFTIFFQLTHGGMRGRQRQNISHLFGMCGPTFRTLFPKSRKIPGFGHRPLKTGTKIGVQDPKSCEIFCPLPQLGDSSNKVQKLVFRKYTNPQFDHVTRFVLQCEPVCVPFISHSFGTVTLFEECVYYRARYSGLCSNGRNA